MIRQKYVDEYIELYRSGEVKFNNERELLIEYLEKYVLNRDDLYFDDEMIEKCIRFGEKWYFPLQSFQKFLIAFVFLFYNKNGRVFYRKFLWMLGRGGGFQQWGHIRFVEGNRGFGFYVCNSNGWHFNSLGERRKEKGERSNSI
ncbi:hypothetical protein BK765_11415 [Bacillus thuringiensis serovar dakota]|nr:hypothetical protein BK765_11415 [Bacillus thuringiensis serovar dakota]